MGEGYSGIFVTGRCEDRFGDLKFWVTFWAFSGGLVLVSLGLMGILGGLKLWPHSHLPVTINIPVCLIEQNRTKNQCVRQSNIIKHLIFCEFDYQTNQTKSSAIEQNRTHSNKIECDRTESGSILLRLHLLTIEFDCR